MGTQTASCTTMSTILRMMASRSGVSSMDFICSKSLLYSGLSYMVAFGPGALFGP